MNRLAAAFEARAHERDLGPVPRAWWPLLHRAWWRLLLAVGAPRPRRDPLFSPLWFPWLRPWWRGRVLPALWLLRVLLTVGLVLALPFLAGWLLFAE